MSFCLLFVTLILAYLLVHAARKNKPIDGFRSFFPITWVKGQRPVCFSWMPCVSQGNTTCQPWRLFKISVRLWEVWGGSTRLILCVCTRSHRWGISWSQTVCINTRELSFYPLPCFCAFVNQDWGGEEISLHPELSCCASLPSASLWVVLNWRVLEVCWEKERAG